MKNLSLSVRRVRTTLRTSVDTGSSFVRGGGANANAGGGGGLGGTGIITAPPAGSTQAPVIR